MAQALKAVVASKEIERRSHGRLLDYVKELAKSLEDESIWDAFQRAQSLHSNFYETGLTRDVVAEGAEFVRMALAKLSRLIPEEKN